MSFKKTHKRPIVALMNKGFIPSHGGYQQLLSYRKSEIIYDATVYFTKRFKEGGLRERMPRARLAHRNRA